MGETPHIFTPLFYFLNYHAIRNADAILTTPNGESVFVEPHVEQMAISHFFERLDNTGTDSATAEEVVYLQSQNGNIYSGSAESSEFEELRPYVPAEVEFAFQAFGQSIPQSCITVI